MKHHRRARDWFGRAFASVVVLVLSLLWVAAAQAHSVGQIQTTIYLAPETVQQLRDNLNAGRPGMRAGDTISYIVQFTPVANGATIGGGGWVTDYIPSNTLVTGASFVQPDGSGGFTTVAPPATALMPDGWGGSAQQAFNANWTGLVALAGSATATACTSAGFTLANCNARLSELYADTGIFYSTDPLTAVYTYPSTDGRVRAHAPYGSGNGYNTLVTLTGGGGGGGPVITLLGGDGTHWSTHNYWDAAMTNAFGSGGVTSAGTLPAFPRATNFVVNPVAPNPGRLSTPFNAGSPVAGPDTGYQLDYRGVVGPWQRVYYPNSTIGKTSNGPATAAGANVRPGSVTGVGWNLSAANPLPANTNAVRWALGRIAVGNNQYVKITLLLTADPPASGLINNSSVFGGDASAEDGSAVYDNMWLYSPPSVADNNSNLLVLKTIAGVCSGATQVAAEACSPVDNGNGGAVIPTGFVKLRYRLTYLNSGNSIQTNVKLSDLLPYNAALVKTIEAGNIYVISGADIRPAVTTLATTLSSNGAAVGAGRGAAVALTSLLTTSGQQTANFTTIPSLASGGGGALEIDVIVGDENGSTATALAANTTVSNTGRISSSQVSGALSTANSSANNSGFLQVSKTTSTPTASPSGTVGYTIQINNTGSGAATNIAVDEFLPSDGGSSPSIAAHAFTVVAGTATQVIQINGVTQTGTNNPAPVLTAPPTISPYSGLNRQQVVWTFPAALSIPASGSMTIAFTAVVGTNTAASAVAYTNDVITTYNNGASTSSATVNDTAPVTVNASLNITKTIDCVYNTALTACNAYTGSGIVPSNSKVRYKLAYVNTTASPVANVYVCDRITSTQSSPAFASTVTQPSFAPTPNGPYQDSPAIGVPAQIVAASATATACGYSGANTYAYPVIASVAANATGTVYFDLATNVTSTFTLSNTGKITNGTVSAASAVSVVARDVANLVIGKSTSTPTIIVNGVATYTINIVNTGDQAAGNIKIYDFLPFVGTTSDATQRFSYVATSATSGLTGVTPTTSVPPSVLPNSNNANQQQVLWDFGAGQTLAAGASATITFTAQAGTGIPAGGTAYTNDVQATNTDGAGGTVVRSSGVSNAAPVTIPISLAITKSIDCVYVGVTCTSGSYVAGSGLPVNAKVRYRFSYQNIGSSSQTNVVLSDTLPSQTGAGSVSNVQLVSGTTPPSTTITPASPPAGGTFTFASIATLAAGASGVVTFDVQTTGATGNTVTNLGKIASTQDSIGQTSSVSAVVTNLVMTKSIIGVCTGSGCTPAGPYTAGTPIAANAKIRYAIAFANPSGGAAIGNIRICDQLPTQIVAASGTYVTQSTSSGTTPTAAGLTFPANAACSFSGTNSFSYTSTVTSLASPGSGTVTFDVQTTGGAGDVVTNLGQLVTGSQIVTSSASARVGVPSLALSKTVSPSSTAPGGAVTYTFTIANNGTAPTTTLKAYDLLPFSGTTVDATKRFVFDTTFAPTFVYSTTTVPGSNPTAITANPPTVSPYSGNPNQQQVLWDFGSYALAAGGSITITFRAVVGSAVPTVSYYNTAYTEFTSGSGGGSANAVTALVSVTTPTPSLVFMKTVSTVSDPVHSSAPFFNIPGAEVVYTLRVTNTGPGTVDANSIFIRDVIPTNSELFVGDLSGAGTGPIQFVQGSPSSNLSWTYSGLGVFTDDVDFSSDGGSTWGKVPTPPYDPTVNLMVRLNPKGTMAGASGGNPYFEVKFKVRIK